MNKLSKNQQGVSLIEILISVLVFGVGILGLGSLQIASLKSSSNAHYRTTASVLAQDLVDRMKSNTSGVSDGYYGGAVSCSAVEDLCRRGNSCTGEELATFDLQEVMCGSKRGSSREGGVQGLLPSGGMTVTCAGGCGTGVTHNIQITWNAQKTDGRQTGDDQSRSLTMPVIP